MHGIAYDAIHDEIVIPVALSGAVLVFKADASGEVPPARAIQGTRTRLVRPHTVAVDPVNNEILTADPSMRAIVVFDRTANGNVAPKRVISGPNTGLLDIVGLDVDPIRNVIVASSRKGNGDKVGLFVFDRLANGDVAPTQFIGGPNSKLAHFRQVTIDPATGNIFLAQQNTRMKQMEAYVLDKPREEFQARGRSRSQSASSDEDDDSDEGRLDQMGFIAVYAPDDNGDIPPRAIIKGPGIRLAGAAGVALNPKKKEIITVGGNGFQTFLLPEFFKPFKKTAVTQP